MDDERWDKAKRVFYFIVAIGLWVASFKFSVAGFNIEVADAAWVGWILGATITAFELAFNSRIAGKDRNLTIYVVGIVCYVYGVLSNFIGLWGPRDLSFDSIMNNGLTTLFLLVISLIGEIGPEVLMVKALGVNDKSGEGDFIKNFFSSSGSKSSSRAKSVSNDDDEPTVRKSPVNPANRR